LAEAVGKGAAVTHRYSVAILNHSMSLELDLRLILPSNGVKP
jgi:hypothetical protein